MFHGMARWFSLHRFAVSLHHRLISVLPPGAYDMLEVPDVEKAAPNFAGLNYRSARGMHGPNEFG
jgi:hypothetical protein